MENVKGRGGKKITKKKLENLIEKFLIKLKCVKKLNNK